MCPKERRAETQEAAATGLLEELLAESVLPPKGCVVPTRRDSRGTQVRALLLPQLHGKASSRKNHPVGWVGSE